MSEYAHLDYPKVLYHETEEPQTVGSNEEHQALGAGWSEEPVPYAAPVPLTDDEFANLDAAYEAKQKKGRRAAQ